MKSASNIKEINYNEENDNSLFNSVKRENAKNNRIFIGTINKSDKKPKNKKLSVFSISANNTCGNEKKVKSSEKNMKKSFETKR